MENKLVVPPSGQRSSPMAFMNKVINPLVRLILSSPLHSLMSDSLLIISYHGRKTGQEYRLPVQYAQAGNSIYIVLGMPEQKTWWRNLKEAAPIQLSLHGRILSGNAIVLKPEADSAAILEGFGAYLRRFPAMAKVHHIRVEADGSFNAEDLRIAATQAVIILVKLK